MNIIVGVSDARTSVDPSHVLATYSLGSCIGVAAYDPTAKVGGLLHFQLPDSAADAARAVARPLMFADSGMRWLLNEMATLGADKRRLRIVIAGGAQMLNDGNVFDIGRRNHTAIRKVMWQQGLMIAGEHVGGTSPRTLYLRVADGTLTIRGAHAAAAA